MISAKRVNVHKNKGYHMMLSTQEDGDASSKCQGYFIVTILELDRSKVCGVPLCGCERRDMHCTFQKASRMYKVYTTIFLNIQMYLT